jgi:hypothetical protein
MFETVSDNLLKALEITESSFLLAPKPMLENSTRFLAAFSQLLNANLKREANGIVTHLVEVLIQSAAALGGPPAVESLTRVLVDTHFLMHLLSGLRRAHDSHQATGPNRPSTDVDGIVETDHLAVLARLLLSSPTAFVAALGAATDSAPEATLDWVLTEWFSHFENVGSPDRKKLQCLALTALLDLGPRTEVLGRLQQLMGVWTDVITECVEISPDGVPGPDLLVYWNPDALKSDEDGPDAPEKTRRRNVGSRIGFVWLHVRALMSLDAVCGPGASDRCQGVCP